MLAHLLTLIAALHIALAPALATSYLNPSEPDPEPGEADPSWREDLAWASEGNLTLTMMELPGAEDGAGFATSEAGYTFGTRIPVVSSGSISIGGCASRP